MTDVVDPRAARSQLYQDAHGAPATIVEPEDDGIAIEAFELDFAAGTGEDLGWVLVTNGMSDRRMTLDADALEGVEQGVVKPRAELMWYVREPLPEYIDTLRWLAQFPFVDDTWLGFGHAIPMPEPIFDGCDATTFLFLGPIISRHQEIADALVVDGDAVELLVVHLLTPAEYRFKREQGTDAVLNLFDAGGYPLVFDPERASLV